MGFTWFSLTDQIDWQHALRVERNDVYAVGLYDLDRKIRPVGVAYRELIAANAAFHDAVRGSRARRQDCVTKSPGPSFNR